MAIAYNSTSYSNDTTGSAATTLTVAHTCNAADTKLVVAGSGAQTVTGITYDGVAMTLIAVEESGYQKIALYYLDNPTTGSAKNIIISYSSSSISRLAAACGLSGAFLGASGIGTPVVTPLGSYGTGTTQTTNITTTNKTSDIFCCHWANTYDARVTQGAGQVSIVKNTADSGAFNLMYKATTTPGAYSVSQTVSQAINLSAIVVELKWVANNTGNFFAFM